MSTSPRAVPVIPLLPRSVLAGAAGPALRRKQVSPQYRDNLSCVDHVNVIAGGTGYTSATVSFSGGGGSNAAATATIGQTPTGTYSVKRTRTEICASDGEA